MKKYFWVAALLLVSSVAFGVYVQPPYIVTLGGTGDTTFTANLPLIGNGAGAIAQGTRSGNTTQFGTTTGTLTSGDCVKFDASGNLIDAGAACGSGSGTVTSVALTVPSFLSVSGSPVTTSGTLAVTLSGTALPVANGGTGQTTLTNHGVLIGAGTSGITQLAAAAAGTLLAGQGTSSDPSFTATPTLGVAGTTLGTLAFTGNTSGTITTKPQAAAGTWEWDWPTTAGSAGQVLTSQGGAGTAMTWTTPSGGGGGGTTNSITFGGANYSTNCSGTCTILSNGGTSAWVTAISRSNAGTYTITMTGFSYTPACTCSCMNGASSQKFRCSPINSDTWSTTNLEIQCENGSGTNSDAIATITCGAGN